MPFGLVFALLFFGGVCPWIAIGLLGHPLPQAKLAGLLLATLGLSLACGLLRRRAWARWGGAACAGLAAASALRLVSQTGAGLIDHVLLLASAATAVLLVVPATGAPGRGNRTTPARRRAGAPEVLAATSFAGLVALGAWSGRAAAPAPPQPAQALPASAVARSVRWADFAAGLEQAGATGKPVLATFVTSWCPYCTKMSRQTWRAPAVAERLQATIPVRVDVEDPKVGGPALAARYGIRGYPVQLLLDAEGGVVARRDGYQTADELIRWLDSALERHGGPGPAGGANPARKGSP